MPGWESGATDVWRLLLVLDGVDRQDGGRKLRHGSADAAGSWAHRYNAEGVSGHVQPSPAGSTLSAERGTEGGVGGNGSGGSHDPETRFWLCAGGALI